MNGVSPNDLRWLDAAARIAMPWRGTTAENPAVGALVVDDARHVLLGRGVTAPGGRPHAETQALAAAGEGTRGAALYVTLEPCRHWGKTPPCVDAVLEARIGRVVVGMIDPDPRTAGQSIARLREAGIAVLVAGHEPSRRLHEGFLTRVTAGRPFVTAKLAISSDGMVGRPFEANVAVTGDAARRWTHLQRALSDAVLVGGSTANIDDPRLNVRLKGLEARSPHRLVLAGREPLFADLRLFTDGGRTSVVGRAGTGVPEGVPLWAADGGQRPDLGSALAAIGGQGIGRLLVESGPALTGALLDEGFVDRFHLLVSPREIGPDGQPATVHGSIEDHLLAAGLAEVDRRALGDDMLRTFERP